MNLADFVGGTWADVFGVAPRELLGAGTRVIADPPGLADYRGLYVLRIGDGCTISAPADIAPQVLEGAQNREPDEVFRPEAVRALAGADAGLVLGPSIHADVDAAAFIHPGPCDARRLGPTDADARRTRQGIGHPTRRCDDRTCTRNDPGDPLPRVGEQSRVEIGGTQAWFRGPRSEHRGAAARGFAGADGLWHGKRQSNHLQRFEQAVLSFDTRRRGFGRREALVLWTERKTTDAG